MAKRPPPGCGLDLNKPVLYHPYMHGPQGFHAARRLRKCTHCGQVVAQTPGSLICPRCQFAHNGNETFLRLFRSLHLRAGRRSGKTQAAAYAVREELAVPNQRWWACAPDFKIMHDSTEPTLLGIIPQTWVKDWSQEHKDLLLWNGSLLQFRSLHDVERGRGPGLNGVWLDEAAQVPPRAWKVLSPSLTENLGIVLPTTSPNAYDWTYEEFYAPAMLQHVPGYWAAKFHTIDNPRFAMSVPLQQEVAAARLKNAEHPEFFAAEYEGEDVNATESVYGTAIDAAVLA